MASVQFNKKLNNFSKQYSLTKTIRMELVPHNNDAKNLIHDFKTGAKNGITKGKIFAENYVIAKNVLDDYYRKEVNTKLLELDINKENKIEKAFDLFLESKRSKDKKNLDSILKELRSNIAAQLKPIKDIKYNELINLHAHLSPLPHIFAKLPSAL